MSPPESTEDPQRIDLTKFSRPDMTVTPEIYDSGDIRHSESEDQSQNENQE